MRTWMHVANLAATKNLDGGLVARSAAGLPLLLEEGMQVALVPPVLDAPRNVTVSSLRPRSDTEAVVFFEEVTSGALAELLVGRRVLVRRADVDLQALEAEDDLPSWEGWRLLDENAGYVGEVLRIEERPFQPLLVVGRSQGAEALVPLADDLIVSVDEESCAILMRLAPGLLEL